MNFCTISDSLIKDLWLIGHLVISDNFLWTCSLSNWGPSQGEVEGAARWRLQAVTSTGTAVSSTRALSFGCWKAFLKSWLASLSFVLAAYFSPAPSALLQLLTCTFTPSFLIFICPFSFLLFLMWFMICSEIFAFTLWFWFLHFSSVPFCHVYIPDTHILLCVCTVFLKVLFSGLFTVVQYVVSTTQTLAV